MNANKNMNNSMNKSATVEDNQGWLIVLVVVDRFGGG